MAAVTHRHSGQHTAGAAIHAAAQGCTEFLLQAVGAGAEAAALAQNFKIRFVFVRYGQQGNAVGVSVHPAACCGCRQGKASLHPLACFAVRQRLALHPEGHRLAVHFFHMQDRIHDAGVIGVRDRFHLCRQHQRTPGVPHPKLFHPVLGVQHGRHARSGPQQDAQRCRPRLFKDAEHQAKGNKKCRKRHKKFRLRQKSAH